MTSYNFEKLAHARAGTMLVKDTATYINNEDPARGFTGFLVINDCTISTLDIFNPTQDTGNYAGVSFFAGTLIFIVGGFTNFSLTNGVCQLFKL